MLELGLALWALLVIVRLAGLQLGDYAVLAARAQRQQSRTIELQAPRGVIFDRNLHPLAMSLRVDSVFAVPARLTQPHREARALARILHLDVRDLEGRFASSRDFCWVARKITASQSRQVRALRLPGIYFQKESRRFYPKGDLAAQVLGYVGMDGRGLAGIELADDAWLRGRPGRELVRVDAHGNAYGQTERPAEPGHRLVLTLDENIEYIAQQELDRAMRKTRARQGTVVIENPRTAQILAIANSPTFNPNDFATTPERDMTDAAISDVYEPGSVFKLVTLSAALNEGLATPQQVVYCGDGSILVGGLLIHDHARYGNLSVTDILVHSSDVGAIKLGLRLGDQRFYRYIRAYGFGAPTGIGLPGESPGILQPWRRWLPMAIGAISMGQEIAVTPLQVLSMVSAIAEGGVYHRPRIVLAGGPETADAGAGVLAGRRVVRPAVARELQAMMRQVVLRGTGVTAVMPGYSDAGKTGTAQMVNPGAHAYSQHDYVASFAGFAPLRHPVIAMLVVLYAPQGNHEGEYTAAPVFRRIAERVLPYMGVPQDLPGDSAALEAEASPPPPPVVAPALTAPAPRPGLVVVALGGAVPGVGASTMPQFRGRPLRAAAEQCAALGLRPRLVGHGAAVAQQPPAGAALAPGQSVTIWFGRAAAQSRREPRRGGTPVPHN